MCGWEVEHWADCVTEGSAGLVHWAFRTLVESDNSTVPDGGLPAVTGSSATPASP